MSFRNLACLLLFAGLQPASATTRYVWQGSPNPAPPYLSWATAARDIQDAVDAAQPGDTVLVTNGVYATGVQYAEWDLTYRVVVDKPITVKSVNGPETTVIEGDAPVIVDEWGADGGGV